MEHLIRNCPICNIEIHYKTKSGFNKGVKTDSKCKTCKYKEKSLNMKGVNNPFYGKTHSLSTKAKLSSLNKGKHFSVATQFKKGHIPTHDCNIYNVWKNKYDNETYELKVKNQAEKLSLANRGSKNPMFGKSPRIGSGNGWSGWYKGWYFRSILELSYMIFVIERFKLNWKSAESKSYRIPYTYLNTDRTYAADFIIGDYLIEIKPKQLTSLKINKVKAEAAIRFCRMNNLVYKVTSCPKLKIDEFESLLQKGDLKLTQKYKNLYEKKYKTFSTTVNRPAG